MKFATSGRTAPPFVKLHEARGAAAGEQADEVDNTRFALQIGEILRGARPLTEPQVEQILQFQQHHGVLFGEAAVALRLVTQDEVMWALSQQFRYPYSTPTTPAARGAGRGAPELVVAAQPFGPQAEAFRELRSQLLMGVLAPEQPRRALAVVSPDRGDGKTYVAANLAVALSQLGGHTLLIDADLRTPRQHAVFGIDGATGLSGILSGRSETNVIRPVAELPHLFVLPVGVVPPNPLELLQRAAFAMLVHELLTRFDHIVVDTPAASQGPDTRVAAARCGAALAIGRPGRSRMDAMERLLTLLGSAQVTMAGVVLNER